ncbi:MAG: ATP-binding protein, partial [Deltaproteobacteria bacterium]|nr:ATP-binding protein [Deltaproteobacteria bacterium]
ENKAIYRSEFLAYTVFLSAERGECGASLAALRELQRSGRLEEHLRSIAAERHEEGHDRGVHDHDAAKILDRLLVLHDSAGLLRFASPARALGQLFWEWHDDSEAKRRWSLQAQSLGRLRRSLGRGDALVPLAREVASAIDAFVERAGLRDAGTIASPSLQGLGSAATLAGAYLVEELTGEAFFTVSADAESLRDGLLRHLDVQGMRRAFDDDMRALEGKVRERHALAAAWLEAFIAADPTREVRRHAAPEAVAMLGSAGLSRVASAALCEADVAGLLGQHPRIERGTMKLRIDEFVARLGRYVDEELPAYREYRKLRAELVRRERASLRLSELQPKVMSAFVRNKLVNEVYLPLVGDNFAKQLGAAGEGKRTDLMGLLLLVSPPGYGKTTLMEYVANRLGLVFVKVNGPALGHGVVSIDPAEAPNATARQEVEKINLAFEMGNNVMLYLDDIQHTNPELLQKFISLCDAQRRIEGIFRGKTKTYDFRGRKFCVVMAGNPYTESGEAFKIPDMLANRADTYNLGDVLSGKEDAFASSYLENALTSNPVLQPLATREPADVDKMIRMARGEPIASTDLKHGYSAAELGEILTVFRHLGRIQKTLLAVNQEYIASAAQDDRFRTEPPFKLQGSYRNMNKLAEKVVPAMTGDDIDTWVSTHYQGEAQTLTTGAEANLLKLGELRGRLEGKGAERWEEIKREYVRHKRMGAASDDPMTRLAGTIAGIGADLQSIRDVLGKDRTAAVAAGLTEIRDALGQDRSGAVASELEGIKALLAEDRSLPITVALEGLRAAVTKDRMGPLAQSLTEIRDALGQDRSEALIHALDELRGAVGAGSVRGIEEAIDGLRLDLRAVREVLMRRATTPPPPDGSESADAPFVGRAGQHPLIEEALVPLARAAVMRGEESAVALAAVRTLLERVGPTPSRRGRGAT